MCRLGRSLKICGTIHPLTNLFRYEKGRGIEVSAVAESCCRIIIMIHILHYQITHGFLFLYFCVSFVRSLVRSVVRSFIHSLIHPFIHSFLHACIYVHTWYTHIPFTINDIFLIAKCTKSWNFDFLVHAEYMYWHRYRDTSWVHETTRLFLMWAILSQDNNYIIVISNFPLRHYELTNENLFPC